MPRDFIGGFFELELPAPAGGFLRLWRVSKDPNLSFALGRSALRALVTALDPLTVWIPAYICPSVPSQIEPRRLRYYPVGEHLEPDVDFLAGSVVSGDLVVAMNYFGHAPAPGYRSFTSERQDVTFIEDCAHTIDTGVPPWGDYRIFSPRKLLGVPDGGIIVPARSAAPDSIKTVADPDVESIAPLFLRYEDSTGALWNRWHADYESWRLNLQTAPRRMSRLSRTILGLTDPAEVAKARAQNFAVLRELLGSISYLDEVTDDLAPPPFVPFGFPIRLPPATRDLVRAKLWQAKVYAFRHFADLASPGDEFPIEHALSAELITLPCDQRYTVDDMEFVGAVVRTALANLTPA